MLRIAARQQAYHDRNMQWSKTTLWKVEVGEKETKVPLAP